MNNFKSEINHFSTIIDWMPNDIDSIWNLLGEGLATEFKKPTGIDTYESIFLPEKGSEQDRFRDLMWAGTWESLVDIDEKKCKKLKFLNNIDNIKQRYLAALKFMDMHGPRSSYWSRGESPEDNYF